MGIELERKFLVRGNAYKKGAMKKEIAQGFLNDNLKRVVRVRIMGDEAFLTIKGFPEGIGRKEFEYAIPLSEAKELLSLCMQPIIKKTRFIVQYKGLNWEVDEFKGENKGLVIAEVELPQPEFQVDLPGWVGKEVTSEEKYYNANLARNPFNRWI